MFDAVHTGYAGYIPQQQPTPIQSFGGTLVAAALPKVLTIRDSGNGNVVLYEITKATILLTLPQGMELPSSVGIPKGDKPLPTPHGNKTGYVFYKNRSDHISKLNDLLNGPDWQKELSEPLPPPVVAKEPVLLVKRVINFEGRSFEVSLWEYSDKCLTVFCPVDISKGNDKLLKPWRSLTCPDSPSGKADGYMCFKNNSIMINFMKQVFPDVPFESMYTKSPAVMATKISQQREPQIIESKQFMSGDVTFVLDLVEYSESSIVLFPTPMFALQGMQQNDSVKHPTQGVRPGFVIPKANTQVIDTLKSFFGFSSNLESLYVMTEEVSRGVAIIPPAGLLPPGPGQNVSSISNGLADMSMKSLDDIPIETLVRILRTKLTNVKELTSKNLIGEKLMFYGEETEISSKIEENDHLSIAIEIKCGTKSLVVLENNDM